MSELDGVLSKEIVEQGLREFPNECCGVIAAAGRRPGEGLPHEERRRQPRSPTGSTARSSCRSSTRSTSEGWELWAIYHSHTHPRPTRRETDIRLAFYPEARYILVSLADRERTGDPLVLDPDGEVTEEELTIT